MFGLYSPYVAFEHRTLCLDPSLCSRWELSRAVRRRRRTSTTSQGRRAVAALVPKNSGGNFFGGPSFAPKNDQTPQLNTNTIMKKKTRVFDGAADGCR